MVPRRQLPVRPSFLPLPVRTYGRTDGGWPIFYLPLLFPLSYLDSLGERSLLRVWYVFVLQPLVRFPSEVSGCRCRMRAGLDMI